MNQESFNEENIGRIWKKIHDLEMYMNEFYERLHSLEIGPSEEDDFD